MCPMTKTPPISNKNVMDKVTMFNTKAQESGRIWG